MADFFGVKQKTISSWLNPKIKTKFSTERQYQILNFLFSRSMKHMRVLEMFCLDMPYYLNNFDYLGYYAVNWKLEDYLHYPENFFYLMQNRKILSDVDQLMFDYMDMPIPLYRMLIRQFESAFRYAQHPPGSQWKCPSSSEYEQFDDTAFYEFLSGIRTELINREETNYNIRNTGSILQKHRQALAKCLFLGTKQEQQSEREQIAEELLNMKTNPKGEKEKDYQKFHKQLMNIVRNVKPYTERRPKRTSPSIEQLMEQTDRLYFEMQDIIFHHIPAFLDTISFNNKVIDSLHCQSFEATILYPLVKKMLHLPDKGNLIHEMESEIFKQGEDIHYVNEGRILLFTDGNEDYKEIKTRYRNINNSLQVYLTMSKMQTKYRTHRNFIGVWCAPYLEIDESTGLLVEKICPEERKYREFEKNKHEIRADFAKNAERLLVKFPQMDIYELIEDKLDFRPEDWHLWGLIQVGLTTNPRMTMQKILDFMETPDEILTFSIKKEEK